MEVQHESIDFDVLFVGGGPACLAGAIRLMQLAGSKQLDLEVALIDKGAEIGAHAVSGAVLNPVALAELIPDYRDQGCPIEDTVHGDRFYYLTTRRHFRVPYTPRYLRNEGFHVVSLARYSRWLAQIAEDLGVNIFPGFAGQEVLFDEGGMTVVGVRTGDKGMDKDGNPLSNFEPGVDLRAKVTVFGEGARGSLFKALDARLGLSEGKMPQVYETGIKEVIEVPEETSRRSGEGRAMHFLGYPLGLHPPGGGFIYTMAENRLALGLLVALSYEDPLFDPHEAFLQFKRHPFISRLIEGGRVVEQGARTVATGGYYSQPRLSADGALFVGGAAGIHNVPALKGIHVAMQSGMLAAETVVAALEARRCDRQALKGYDEALETGWIGAELWQGRNFTQALNKRGLSKLINLGAQYLSKGRGLRDPLPLEADEGTLKALPAAGAEKISAADPPACDDTLYVDKLTGVYLSKTNHREDQPCHLTIHDLRLCVEDCYHTYRNPCTRFCPGNVYAIETEASTGQRQLKLTPSNCLHCKTCDIKDPYGNITWNCPEGGGGPGYTIV